MKKYIILLLTITCMVFYCMLSNEVYALVNVDNNLVSLTLPDRFKEKESYNGNNDEVFSKYWSGIYANNDVIFNIDVYGGFYYGRECSEEDLQRIANSIEKMDSQTSQVKVTYDVLSSTLTTIDNVSSTKIRYKYSYNNEKYPEENSVWYYEYYMIWTDHASYYINCCVKNSQDYLNTTEYKNMINSIILKDTVANTRIIPFTDVKTTSWYYTAVKYCYENKIINGISKSTFKPNTKVTRGMLVTILYNMENNPKVSGDMKFSDVLEGKYYYNAVLWASQNNVVSGSNGKFNPTENITRQDVAAMLKNYANYKKKYIASNYDLTSFPDYKDVSTYAQSAMKWAVKNKIINGSNGMLNPKETAARAEAASMIYNYCNKIGR